MGCGTPGGCGGSTTKANSYTPKSKSATTRATGSGRPAGAAAWGSSGGYGKAQVKLNFSGKKR